MTNKQAALALRLLFIAGAVVTPCASYGQILPTKPTLQTFFRALVERRDPLPDYGDVLRVTDQVGTERPEDISSALPVIMAALADQDDVLKSDSAIALFSIGLRADSAALLGTQVNGIGALLMSPNPRLQTAAVQVLGMLRPSPPEQVFPILFAYVKRTDSEAVAQASALSVLFQLAPEKLETIAAAEKLLARPSDAGAKETIVNGIANSQREVPQLTDLVIGSLSDPDEGVRFTTSQALGRMSKDALLRARLALRALVENPDESARVRAAAKQTLESRGTKY